MSAGFEGTLYLLAFDHRESFQEGLFGIHGTPSAAQAARIARSKEIAFEGLRRATSAGVPREHAGLLVDERFGAEVARQAKAEGFRLAMPVEKSGQAEFQFWYGEDFAAHIEAFDPDFAKVLVRYNPDGQTDLNRRQLSRLRRLSDWLHEHRRSFLFELLVPPEKAQLDRVGGSRDRYDREVRPDLVVRTIAEAQAARVEPDIWKIEGLDRREDCVRVAQAARAGGRSRVACIVLGRGADEERLAEWLRQAAGVEGFRGFAIGRTIWWDALATWLAGERDPDETAELIAANYRRMVGVYQAAAARAPAR
jgi:myo-inositol catabolism protein IolC